MFIFSKLRQTQYKAQSLSWNSGKPYGQNGHRRENRKQTLSPPTRHGNTRICAQELCLVRILIALQRLVHGNLYKAEFPSWDSGKPYGQNEHRRDKPQADFVPSDSPWERPYFCSGTVSTQRLGFVDILQREKKQNGRHGKKNAEKSLWMDCGQSGRWENKRRPAVFTTFDRDISLFSIHKNEKFFAKKGELQKKKDFKRKKQAGEGSYILQKKHTSKVVQKRSECITEWPRVPVAAHGTHTPKSSPYRWAIPPLSHPNRCQSIRAT